MTVNVQLQCILCIRKSVNNTEISVDGLNALQTSWLNAGNINRFLKPYHPAVMCNSMWWRCIQRWDKKSGNLLKTLSVKTAGTSMPSSLAAQASPRRCRSQPSPTVASRRIWFWQSTASRNRRNLHCRSQESSVIARTQRTDCCVTGLMFSVRPSPNSLPHTFLWYFLLSSVIVIVIVNNLTLKQRCGSVTL